MVSDSALREHIKRHIQEKSFQHIRIVIGIITAGLFQRTVTKVQCKW